MAWERTARIESAQDGLISGVLATNGEASDGHILDIASLKTRVPAPLLFGHDDFSGRNNLGSWTEFEKLGDGSKPGSQKLKGRAKIETAVGVGAPLEFRQDMAAMISEGHVGQFSIRWDTTETPTRRLNLPSDHPAAVDGKKVKPDDPRYWGLYFERAEMLEGSVVTIGADPKALIGRAADANGQTRSLWVRGALEAVDPTVDEDTFRVIATVREGIQALRMRGFDDFGALLRTIMNEGTDAAALIPIDFGEGKRILVPIDAYLAMRERADQVLDLATSLLESMEHRSVTHVAVTDNDPWPEEEEHGEDESVLERQPTSESEDTDEREVPVTTEPVRDWAEWSQAIAQANAASANAGAEIRSRLMQMIAGRR